MSSRSQLPSRLTGHIDFMNKMNLQVQYKRIFITILLARYVYGSVLTLTGPSSQPVCEGDVMVLTCTHPPLDPPTYLPTVILEMNGMDIPSIHTPINSTATTLSVRVTRKGFQNDMTAMFGCVILQRATNSTFAEVKSSKQTVTAAFIPLQPSLMGGQIKSTSISLTWEYDSVCFEDYTFSFIISWCTVENGVPDVSTCNSTTTSTTDITLSNLVPSTTYQGNITAQSVENSTIRSDTMVWNVTTMDTDVDENTTKSSKPGGADDSNSSVDIGIISIIISIIVGIVLLLMILQTVIIVRYMRMQMRMRRRQQYNTAEETPHDKTNLEVNTVSTQDIVCSLERGDTLKSTTESTAPRTPETETESDPDPKNVNCSFCPEEMNDESEMSELPFSVEESSLHGDNSVLVLGKKPSTTDELAVKEEKEPEELELTKQTTNTQVEIDDPCENVNSLGSMATLSTDTEIDGPSENGDQVVYKHEHH